MRTSATGTAELGFTLVELLAVIAIVGLASGAAILALPEADGGVRMEATRLAARAQAAQERAVMDNRPVALVVGPESYGFEWRSGGEWRPVGTKPLLERRWDEGTRVELGGGERRITFDSTGFAEPARIRLRRGDEEAWVEIADGGRVRVLP
jgi:general secretion pathway protein H